MKLVVEILENTMLLIFNYFLYIFSFNRTNKDGAENIMKRSYTRKR